MTGQRGVQAAGGQPDGVALGHVGHRLDRATGHASRGLHIPYGGARPPFTRTAGWGCGRRRRGACRKPGRPARSDRDLLGYATSSRLRDKPAYDTSVETTVYCAPSALGRGAGSLLYDHLFRALASEDLHRAYAGIAMPNDASVALHLRHGFRELGTYAEVGRKFGRYWDVRWFERVLP
ncbi:MAG: GNAT family N-acetyltransferase [Actinomycetes bacterium]